MSSMSESDDEEIWTTIPEISEAAENLRGNLLPAKSREKYEGVYRTFMAWMKEKEEQVIIEHVVLAYFDELDKKNYKPSTLWATYSMLRSTISIHHKINLENFKQLLAFLKQKSIGYQGKKSKVFSAGDIRRFLDTAPDDQYLVTKVVLIFGICGACRGTELTKLTVTDIRKCDSVMVIKLRDPKTKTFRNFTVEGELLKKVLAYEALRPKNSTSDRFFLNYRNGQCTNQVIGKNKLGGMPKDIATFLNLPNPELYTGHSFRRTSAILCADEGADFTEINRLGGWKSRTVAEGCIEESIRYKRKIGQQISDAIAMASTSFENISFENPAKRPKFGEHFMEPQNEPQISDEPEMFDETQIDNEWQGDHESRIGNRSQIRRTSSQIFLENIPAEQIINFGKQSSVFNFTNCTNITFNFQR